MERRSSSRLRRVVGLAALLLLACTGIAFAGDRRRVPEVIDMPVAAAQAEVKAAGFTATLQETSGEPAGTVGRQSPGGFAWADAGSAVTLFVRRGSAPPPVVEEPPAVPPSVPPAVPEGTPGPPPPSEPPVPAPPPSVPPAEPPSLPPAVPPPATDVASVPNVLGRTEAEALELLRTWRVTVTNVEPSGGNEGRVVDQAPAPGQRLAAGESVTIAVARAGAPPPGAAAVPNVVGLDQDAAVRRLTEVRLVPLVNLVATDPAGAGKVVSQEPSSGVIVARDSNVMLNVGRSASTLLETEVPDLVRLPEAEARTRLTAAGLQVLVRERLAPAPQANAVLEQDLAPGTRIPRGRTVTLTVGRVLLLPIRVPDTLGQDAATAERALADAGFIVERATALSLPGSAGRVIAQVPAGGATATRGSIVQLTIGQAPASTPAGIPVPSFVGQTEAQARASLSALGLLARTMPASGGPGEVGLVKGQSPAAGASVPRGTEVVLQVVGGPGPATNPPAAPVPNYVGGDVASVQADVAVRGWSANLTYVTSTPEGRVVGQNPAPGTPLPRGGQVVLTVSRAPTLPQVALTEPATGTAVPRNFGVTFRWNPVAEAEDYQFEIFVWKDDTWVQADNDVERVAMKRPKTVRKGTYQWHVRARRSGGAILGPWSEWRRLTIY